MPAVRPLGVAAVFVLILLAWAYRPSSSAAAPFASNLPPSSEGGCPQVLFDPQGGEGYTRLLFLHWDRLPQDASIYAFAAPQRVHGAASGQAWQRVAEDPDSRGPHYLISLPNGWLYVVATRRPAPELQTGSIDLRFAKAPEPDSKGAGWDDEPLPALLEADALDGLPADAQVCSGRW